MWKNWAVSKSSTYQPGSSSRDLVWTYSRHHCLGWKRDVTWRDLERNPGIHKVKLEHVCKKYLSGGNSPLEATRHSPCFFMICWHQNPCGFPTQVTIHGSCKGCFFFGGFQCSFGDHPFLVGGFKYFFIFTPTWGNDPIWLINMFQMGG